MSYLLDTDIVSYYIKGKAAVIQRINSMKPSDIAISAITVFELRFGESLNPSDKLTAGINGFVAGVTVLPFEEVAANTAGMILATMKLAGTAIGINDILIGAHALALGRKLVTHNTKDFSRIAGLELEDWSL